MSLINSDAALDDLVSSAKTERINPTKTAGRPFASATKAGAKKEQAISIEDVFDENAVSSNLNQATPVLRDSTIQPSQIDGSIQTFYTTYTYYTTIFSPGKIDQKTLLSNLLLLQNIQLIVQV